MLPVKIQAVGTAVPPHRVDQQTIRDAVPQVFRSAYAEIDRLLSLFNNTGVQTRYFSQPLDWYRHRHTFAESNAAYQKSALELSTEAAQGALRQAGVEPKDIGIIVFVSTTGIATPSLDSKLIKILGLSRNTVRVPVWGLGCAGGVAGLARAAELCRAQPDRKVLLVAVELCSLTFQKDDLSKANLVSTSLFADGAAALVLGADGEGPEVLASYSTLFEDSDYVMGWDLVETGFKVRLSKDLPSITKDRLPEEIEDACTVWGIERDSIRHFVVHPGGAKVLAALSESLHLQNGELCHASSILRDYGNMSSPTVLFILREFLEHTPKVGDYGVMLGMGPGFSAEQILFRW